MKKTDYKVVMFRGKKQCVFGKNGKLAKMNNRFINSLEATETTPEVIPPLEPQEDEIPGEE